jgi:hypothetical protein
MRLVTLLVCLFSCCALAAADPAIVTDEGNIVLSVASDRDIIVQRVGTDESTAMQSHSIFTILEEAIAHTDEAVGNAISQATSFTSSEVSTLSSSVASDRSSMMSILMSQIAKISTDATAGQIALSQSLALTNTQVRNLKCGWWWGGRREVERERECVCGRVCVSEANHDTDPPDPLAKQGAEPHRVPFGDRIANTFRNSQGGKNTRVLDWSSPLHYPVSKLATSEGMAAKVNLCATELSA